MWALYFNEKLIDFVLRFMPRQSELFDVVYDDLHLSFHAELIEDSFEGQLLNLLNRPFILVGRQRIDRRFLRKVFLVIFDAQTTLKPVHYRHVDVQHNCVKKVWLVAG